MAAEKAIDRIESSSRKSNFTALRIFNPPPFRVRDIDPTKAIRRQLLFWPRFQTWRLRSEGRFLGDAIFSPPSSERSQRKCVQHPPLQFSCDQPGSLACAHGGSIGQKLRQSSLELWRHLQTALSCEPAPPRQGRAQFPRRISLFPVAQLPRRRAVHVENWRRPQ